MNSTRRGRLDTLAEMREELIVHRATSRPRSGESTPGSMRSRHRSWHCVILTTGCSRDRGRAGGDVDFRCCLCGRGIHGVEVSMMKLPAALTIVALLSAATAHVASADPPACVDNAPHICLPGNPEGKPAACYDDGGVIVALWPCTAWKPSDRLPARCRRPADASRGAVHADP